MENKFNIRQITEADYSTVYNLIQKAFETAEHKDGSEQDFAVNLRQGPHYIPELDLVAERNGELIGHIMFTRTYVTQPNGNRYNTLLVAPLAVLLEYRSLGAGGALMNEGLRIAQTMGYQSAFLIGDPNYYQRFGYQLASRYDIRHESLPSEYIQAKELITNSLNGITGLINM